MKNNLLGLKEIYTFTVSQSLKAKSLKIVTIIMCVLALFSVPVVSLIRQDDKEKHTNIKRIKVVDLTEFHILENMDVLKDENLKMSDTDELDEKKEKNIYAGIIYEPAEIDFSKMDGNTKAKEIYTFDKNADYVYMNIVYLKGTFQTEIIYSKETKIDSDDVDNYSKFFETNFKNLIIKNITLDKKQQKIVDSANVIIDQKELEKEDHSVDGMDKSKDYQKGKYLVVYILVSVTLFMLAFSGERVGMSIVTEKASKVMEYLLTSVKPMAIILGKVFANITVMLIQISSVVISFIISIMVNSVIFPKGDGIDVPDFMVKVLKASNFPGVNFYNIVFAIIIFMGGFLLYGLIAGLAGASVSKLEEIAEGMKLYSLVMIIGGYISMFMVTSNSYLKPSVLRSIVVIVPFTAIYITPGLIITGYLKVTESLISIFVLCICIVLMIKFVSNVYESMVYYNGTPMKLKDIINISKQKKAGTKENMTEVNKESNRDVEKDGEEGGEQ